MSKNMKDENKFGWSKDELKTISLSLSKKLGPEYISYRQGFGNMRLSYIEGWVIIDLANQIFGFDGWSIEIKSVTIDYSDVCTERNTYSIGVSAISKVTLKNGTFKEDIGFGSADNARKKSEAYKKAKKEAVTDAMKRALRQFGNALGNCCYDKEYLKDIMSVEKDKKIGLEVSNLFRKKAKKVDYFEDSFNSDDIDLSNSYDKKVNELDKSIKKSR
jgi:DNA repair and recombination protein RAD52